jgi:hypothetical protein
VDNGRYTYTPGPWREYFQGPSSHNILLIDSLTSQPKANQTNSPLTGTGFIKGEGYTAAWGEAVFRNDWGAETARWQRSVIDVKGIGLLVLDHLITFQERKITGFWHSSPNTLVQLISNRARFENQSHSVTLSQANSQSYPLDRTLKSGQKTPIVQGWHSPRFNQKKPAACLQYKTSISKPTIFAWLFSPDSFEFSLQRISETAGELNLDLANQEQSAKLTIKLPTKQDPLILNFK